VPGHARAWPRHRGMARAEPDRYRYISVSSSGNLYTIAKSTPYHVQTLNGGSFVLVNSTLTFAAILSFPTTFVMVGLSGGASMAGMAFNGLCSGPCYFAQTTGVIVTNSGSQFYFPGPVAGSIINER
jgi:hypothetical protein